MAHTIQAWHQRYVQQTRWTEAVASYLFQSAKISSSHKILEVGCGTGAVFQELIHPLGAAYCGLDIDPTYLAYFAQAHHNTCLTSGDAHHLPFSSGCFDVSLSHFVLLWVSYPAQTLSEMVRVTRSGGIILALAEPDYGGRIDYPQELSRLGQWQIDSLKHQGADPLIGRQLRALFTNSGITSVETGVLGGQWGSDFDQAEFNSEWDVLHADLARQPEKLIQLPRLKELDRLARQQGHRILYVPTFYAWGYVP